VNDAFCMQVLERLLNWILRVRSQFQGQGSWFVLHENAAVRPNMVINLRLLRSVVIVKGPLVVPQLWYFVTFFYLNTAKHLCRSFG